MPASRPCADHVVKRLEGQIRIDGAAAVADEQRRNDAPRAARRIRARGRRACACLRGSDDDARPPPRAAPGSARCSGSTPRSERIDDLAPSLIAWSACGEQFVQRRFQSGRPVGRWEQNRQRDRLEARAVSTCCSFANSSLVRIGDSSLMSRQLSGVGFSRLRSRADHRLGRGDDFLADGINRRVRDLREELLEIVVEQLRLVREHRQRRVRAHRAERLHAVVAPSGRR